MKCCYVDSSFEKQCFHLHISTSPLRIAFPAFSSAIQVNRVNLLYSRSFIKWLLIISGSFFRDFCLCLVYQSRACCKHKEGESKAQINSLCSSKHVLSELFKKSSLEFPSVKWFDSANNNNNQVESEIRPSENTRVGRIPTWSRRKKAHRKKHMENRTHLTLSNLWWSIFDWKWNSPGLKEWRAAHTQNTVSFSFKCLNVDD